MKEEDFTKPSGRLIKNIDRDLTFVPNPLPPKITFDDELISLLSKADSNLGKLSGMGQLLPNPHILISPYIRREAVLSSRIEGTMASLSDLFLYEITKIEHDDYMRVREVRNYVQATEKAIKILVKNKKIDLDLLKTAHKRLLYRVRGEERHPGNFRDIQNWLAYEGDDIDDAVFIPPLPEKVDDLLLELEKFIQDKPKNIPPLIQCALIHYQFETIHPFLDGNGRIGRLLILLFLCERGLLYQPLLYLSAFFEKNKEEYTDKLNNVRWASDFEGWIKFFLKGVSIQSKEAIENVQQIIELQKKYQKKLRDIKSTMNVERLADSLFSNPYTTTPNVAEYLDVSFPTAQLAIKKLELAGILKEHTSKKRNKVYVATDLLKILEPNY